jgi:hypothetical protein
MRGSAPDDVFFATNGSQLADSPDYKEIPMTGFRPIRGLLVLALSLGFISARESRAQTQSLTAFYTAPVVSMAPMWIAKEAGLFKKQGLDVKLVFIASGPLGTTAILSGDVDSGDRLCAIRAIAGGNKICDDWPDQKPHDQRHRRQEKKSQRQDLKGSVWHRPHRFQPTCSASIAGVST